MMIVKRQSGMKKNLFEPGFRILVELLLRRTLVLRNRCYSLLASGFTAFACNMQPEAYKSAVRTSE